MRCRFAILLLALLAGPAYAENLQGSCDVLFLGSSTFHDFSGTVRSRAFTAPLSRDPAGRRVLPSVEVVFPVADMKTGNETRDTKMRGMFQVDRYPTIHAMARNIDAETVRERFRKDPGGKVPIQATLAIRGVAREIRAAAVNWKEEGDRISFDVEFPVSLAEFDLKAPAVLGILRVADRIVVKGTFTLSVQGDSPRGVPPVSGGGAP